MNSKGPLPSQFDGLPFRTADALAAGITRGRLRAAAKTKIHHGVRADRAPRNSRELDPAYARCMPADAALASVSALRYWRLPLPHRLEDEMVTYVSRPEQYRAPRGKRIRGSIIARDLFDVRAPRGLRVIAPAIAWAQAASLLGDREALTVADAMITAFERYPGRRFPGPLASIEELGSVVAKWQSRRGARWLRHAAELVRPASESPGESRTRYLIVRAGFPEPVVNHWVQFSASEHARAALAYPAHKVAIEYQGEYHYSPEQVIDDLERVRAFRLAGWIVLFVTRRDVENPLAFFTELRAALTSRGAAR